MQEDMLRSLIAALLLTLVGCGSSVTLRRVVHYAEVGVARHLPDAPRRRASQKGPIDWRPTLADARREASQRKRPLVVYMHTAWCGPCKRLKRDTFPDPRVRAILNQRTVPFALDGDSAAGKRFRKRYHVNSYPTMLVFRPGGAEIDRLFGFRQPPQFVSAVDDVLHDRNTVGDLRRRAKAAPESVEIRHRLGLQLALRGDVDEAAEHLRSAATMGSQDKGEHASNALYELGRYVYARRKRDTRGAIRTFEEVLKRFPASAAARRAGIDLANIYLREKNTARAMAVLKTMVRGNRDDGVRWLEAARFAVRNQLDLHAAAAWAKRAGKLRKDGRPWAVLGQIYARQGKRSKGLAAWREAVKRSPNNARFRQSLRDAEARTERSK